MNADEWQALQLSARVALWATVACIPAGVLVAWLLARRDFPGKFVLEILVQLPMVLPPVVPGYLLLMLLGTQGPVGRWLDQSFGIVLAFTWQGAVLASAIMAFPLLVQPIRVAFRLVDARLEQAATTLGATRFDAFRSVTLPLALPGLIAGAVLCFSRSLGEFGATIILAGNMPGVTQTIPLAIFGYTSTPGGDAMALSLCLVSIALSFTVLLAGEAINRSMARKVQR